MTQLLTTYKNEVYKAEQLGPWQRYVKIDSTEKEPVNKWQGGKIPLCLWSKILSFFEWSQATTRSEALVHLFYHEADKLWEALVLPQEGWKGMTVSLLPEHPERAATFARLGQGWEMLGSVHHHCTSSAFQSGTDSADERTKEGLHITIGNVGSKSYSIHARTSLDQVMHPAILEQWFDIAESFLQCVPPDMRAQVVEWNLTRPPENIDFPDWWKCNVIKPSGVIPRSIPGLNKGRLLPPPPPIEDDPFAGYAHPLLNKKPDKWERDVVNDFNELVSLYVLRDEDVERYLDSSEDEALGALLNLLREHNITAYELSNILRDRNDNDRNDNDYCPTL